MDTTSVTAVAASHTSKKFLRQKKSRSDFFWRQDRHPSVYLQSQARGSRSGRDADAPAAPAVAVWAGWHTKRQIGSRSDKHRKKYHKTMAELRRAFRKHRKTLQNLKGTKLESRSNLVGRKWARCSRVGSPSFFMTIAAVLYELCIIGDIAVVLPHWYLQMHRKLWKQLKSTRKMCKYCQKY